MRLKHFLLALAALVLAPTALSASMPSTLNYQGRLRQNVAGSPVVPDSTGNTVTFRIWDSLSGGTTLWSETWPGVSNAVTTSNGLFNVLLGSINPINLLFDQPYFLEIIWTNSVGTAETMTPRQPLTAAPYAFRSKYSEAGSATFLQGRTLTATAPSSGQVLTWNNTLNQWEPGNAAGVSAPLSLTLSSTLASPLSVSNGAGTAVIAQGVTGVVAAAHYLGLSVTVDSMGATGIAVIAANSTAIYALNNSPGGFQTTIFADSGHTNHAVEGRNSTYGSRGILGGSPNDGLEGVYGIGQNKGVWGESVGSAGVYGNGPVGVEGAVTMTGATAIKADVMGNVGSLAIHSLGDAIFDPSGAGPNSVTFNTSVFFNGPVIGGVSVAAPLSLTLSSNTSAPFFANNNGGGSAILGNSSGAAPAVSGVNNALTTTAIGVYGRSNSTNLNAAGVWGENDSAVSSGVIGTTAASITQPGFPEGVYGYTQSVGTGVYGLNTNGGISTSGVFGQSYGGAGVVGSNGTPPTYPGYSMGVFGYSSSAGGYGIYALNTAGIGLAAQGASVGLSTTSTSAGSPVGIYARVSSNGSGYAVQAINDGVAGAGISASGATGILVQGAAMGLSATANGATSNAIYARSKSIGGSNATVFSQNDGGASSIGVSGIAPAGTGVLGSIGTGIAFQPAGVYGSSNNNAIPGVYGYNNNGGVAVVGNSPNGTAGQFGGSTFGISATASTVGSGVGIIGESNNTNYLAGAIVGLNFSANSGNGVYGSGVTGVAGIGTDTGVVGSAGAFGVYGSADGGGGVGVYGTTGDPDGFGIVAVDNQGPGLGAALYVSGNVMTSQQIVNVVAAANWIVVTAGTSPSGSVIDSNVGSVAVTTITVNNAMITARSVVLFTYTGFGSAPTTAYAIVVSPGQFKLSYTGTVTFQNPDGFNFLVIN